MLDCGEGKEVCAGGGYATCCPKGRCPDQLPGSCAGEDGTDDDSDDSSTGGDVPGLGGNGGGNLGGGIPGMPGMPGGNNQGGGLNPPVPPQQPNGGDAQDDPAAGENNDAQDDQNGGAESRPWTRCCDEDRKDDCMLDVCDLMMEHGLRCTEDGSLPAECRPDRNCGVVYRMCCGQGVSMDTLCDSDQFNLQREIVACYRQIRMVNPRQFPPNCSAQEDDLQEDDQENPGGGNPPANQPGEGEQTEDDVESGVITPNATPTVDLESGLAPSTDS